MTSIFQSPILQRSLHRPPVAASAQRFSPLTRASSFACPGVVAPPAVPRGAALKRACSQGKFGMLKKTQSLDERMLSRPRVQRRKSLMATRVRQQLPAEAQFLAGVERFSVGECESMMTARYSSGMPLRVMRRPRSAVSTARLGARASRVSGAAALARYSTGAPLSVGHAVDDCAQSLFACNVERQCDMRVTPSAPLAHYSSGLRLSVLSEPVRTVPTKLPAMPAQITGNYSTGPVSMSVGPKIVGAQSTPSPEVFARYSSSLPVAVVGTDGICVDTFESRIEGDMTQKPVRCVREVNPLAKYSSGVALAC